MTLTIFDREHMTTFKGSFNDLLDERYDRIQLISFVASFREINELLKRFKQVDLILGLEDGQTAASLLHMVNRPAELSQELEDLGEDKDPFLSRLVDGTLRIRFTKDKLIHKKIYILDEMSGAAGHPIRVIHGSANLTKKAMTQNYEQLEFFEGFKGRADVDHYLKDFKAMWNTHTTEYISRKQAADFIGQTKEVIAEVLTDSFAKDIENKALPYEPQEVVQLVKETNEQDVGYQIEIVEELFTSTGALKPKNTLDKRIETIRHVVRRRTNSLAALPTDEETLFTDNEDHWYHKMGEIIVTKGGPDGMTQSLKADPVTKQDAEDFGLVIESFKVNKMTDERASIMQAMLYQFTAPFIWRIRQLWRDNNKSYDQVPIAINMIGGGSTGKSDLMQFFLRPLTGREVRRELDYGSNAFGSKLPQPRVNHFQNRFYSESINPYYLDDCKEGFLSSPTWSALIKSLGNTDPKRPHPVGIFTSNADMGGLDEAITKRVEHISIRSKFDKPRFGRDWIDYKAVSSRLTPNLYFNIAQELNKRLAEPSQEDLQLILDDYLGLTKDILKRMLAEHGVGFDDQVWQGFNYKRYMARVDWPEQIAKAKATAGGLRFAFSDRNLATITDQSFNKNNGIGKSSKANEDLKNFTSLLGAGIVVEEGSRSIVVNIDRFDEYVGEPCLRAAFDECFERQLREEKLVAMTEESNQRMFEALAAMQEHSDKRNAENLTTLIQAIKQPEPTKRKGLFGGIFSREK